jgi:hypothetical protein
LLALLEAHHILHISRIRVNLIAAALFFEDYIFTYKFNELNPIPM